MTWEVSIATPLGEELQLKQFSASEELGRLFVYDATLVSADALIAVDDILGQNVTVGLELPSGDLRYYNGFVTRFSQVEGGGVDDFIYHARIHPWLWFLTRTSDCRIFQDQSVPDIIKTIFSDNGFSDFEDKLNGSYQAWEYCVQYRETDFNFISRLMEQVGIYYYFTHENGNHKLVLADGYSSHEAIQGESELPYHPPGLDQSVDTEHVSNWSLNNEIQPNVYSLTDYNFETPKTSLAVQRQIPRNHAQAGAEIYDYPGEYGVGADGEQLALQRIEELQAQYEQVSGETDARLLTNGGLFTLSEHPREDQNREYLVISAYFELTVGDPWGSDGSSAPSYQCSFNAIESQTPYRTPRTTPKPIVQGPQTAVVVGKSGEEIDPDEYGRVKVQFHWDREGAFDDNSSCWIRCAQFWAGANWGAQFIPRIGHEVIVEFLEGDPDRPLITGSVYNADNMPPYSLPDNKTQSGIKSRSSKEGGESNFNEIRMEDKKGSEELFIQAEKDRTVNVKNNNVEKIGASETITIAANQTETIDKDRTTTVNENDKLTVIKDRTTKIEENDSLEVVKNRDSKIGENDTLDVGKVLKVTAGDEIELVTGTSKLSMKKDGTIELSGLDVTVKNSAGGTININPGGIVTIKGTMVKIN